MSAPLWERREVVVPGVPDVSVITVVLNDKDGLRRTLDSVAAQLGVLIEHIVVDGRSDDGGAEVLKECEPSAGQIAYTSGRDRGIYDAMNKGTGLATGRYLVYLNAGDVFSGPRAVASVVGKLLSQDSKWGFARSDRYDGELKTGASRDSNISLPLFWLGFQWIPHQATFISRHWLEETGFEYDVREGVAADQGLLLRLALIQRPVFISVTVADFGNGGAHSQVTLRQREMLWHGIRSRILAERAGGRCLIPLDRAFAECVSAVRVSKRAVGRAWRRRNH